MIQSLGLSTHDIWVVGDFPTYQDLKVKKVFSKGSGHILCEMLEGVGFDTSKIHFTTASHHRPAKGSLDSWLCTKGQSAKNGYIQVGEHYLQPERYLEALELRKKVSKHKPKLIFALGDFAFMALTDKKSVASWRGSMLERDGMLIIPSFSITQVVKNYDWTFFLKQDFRRGLKYYNGDLPPKPAENFIVRPSYEQVTTCLNQLLDDAEHAPLHLGVDIEGRKVITCIGLAWTKEDAICIPIHSSTHGETGSYWSLDEEVEIVRLLGKLLTHERVLCHGQNFNYDRQHICKLWGFLPRLGMDTMQAWHVCFPLLPKALHSISSFMLPWYLYWKDEGKGHNPDPTMESENQYWVYNCRDCVRTLELVPLLQSLITDCGQRSQYNEQRALNKPTLRMMLKGVAQHMKVRQAYVAELIERISKYEIWFEQITPALMGEHKLVKSKTAKPWYRSPTQQCKLFYEVLGLPAQRNRKTKRPTCEDAALQALMLKEPLLKPVLRRLIEYRSLGVFLSTFCMAPLDWDKRFRCSYGIGMTETFRFTSSKDAFDFGGNLQNIPSGTKGE